MNSSNFLLMNITYLVATICFVCIFYKKEICIQLYLESRYMYTGSSLEVFLVAAIIITLPFIESYSIDEKNETNVIIHCPFY